MTIGEKMLEQRQYKNEGGVFEFTYFVDKDGKRESRRFKGRLDHEFVTTIDGEDFSREPLKGKRNIGIRKGINKKLYEDLTEVNGDEVRKEQEQWVFESMLTGIAIRQCRMLSPIHITMEIEGDVVFFRGEAVIEVPQDKKEALTKGLGGYSK